MPVVYKIYSELDIVKEIYIGSTQSLLKKRISEHKHSCKDSQLILYKYLRHFGFHNFKFEVLIDIHPDTPNLKQELIKYESQFYHIYKPKLNSYEPNRDHKKYCIDNLDMSKYSKDLFRLSNREEIKQVKKEEYNKNKAKYITNAKIYYLKNKELIKSKRSFIINCPCGDTIRKYQFKKHIKTESHSNKLLLNIVTSKNNII